MIRLCVCVCVCVGGGGGGLKFYSCESRPFAVRYEKIRNYLREKATNKAKIHSITPKNERLCINQIQKRIFAF